MLRLSGNPLLRFRLMARVSINQWSEERFQSDPLFGRFGMGVGGFRVPVSTDIRYDGDDSQGWFEKWCPDAQEFWLEGLYGASHEPSGCSV